MAQSVVVVIEHLPGQVTWCAIAPGVPLWGRVVRSPGATLQRLVGTPHRGVWIGRRRRRATAADAAGRPYRTTPWDDWTPGGDRFRRWHCMHAYSALDHVR